MEKNEKRRNTIAEAERRIFQEDWDSLCKWQVPTWFHEAKFGIFIHWGLYSIPAHSNEWYPRNMYIKGQEEWEWQIGRAHV